MRQVTYGGGAFVTSDEIAEALLEYAAALANADRAATVHVPTVNSSGRANDVQVLIGPASQLMTAAIERDEVDVDGNQFLSGVTSRIETLRRTFIPAEDESPAGLDV